MSDAERTCHMGQSTRSMSVVMTMTLCVVESVMTVVMMMMIMKMMTATRLSYRDTCVTMTDPCLNTITQTTLTLEQRWCKTVIQGHSRSFVAVPIEAADMISY